MSREKKHSKKSASGKRSNPVAPTTLSKRIVKLRDSQPLPALSLNEKLAAALETAGRALLDAAAILQGRPTSAGSGTLQPFPLAPGAAWLTVSELVNEFLITKARAAKSDRYLR